MKLLFVGDVVGKPGRRALVQSLLPRLVDHHRVDYMVVNVENAAGGFGVTPEVCERDRRSCRSTSSPPATTSGTRRRESRLARTRADRLLRPANYPDGQSRAAGCTWGRRRRVSRSRVINLEGQVFMQQRSTPPSAWPTGARSELDAKVKVIFVDFHAEATCEKQALGLYLDGRVERRGRHPHPRPHRRRDGPPQGHGAC